MSRRGLFPAMSMNWPRASIDSATFSASAGAVFSGSKRSSADAYAGTAGPNLKTVSQ